MSLERAFGEPKTKFASCGFRVAAAVGEVVLNRQSEVAPNGPGSGFDWVGCAHHRSDRFYCVRTFDRDRNDFAAGQVVDYAAKERSLSVLIIVSFDRLSGGVNQLQTYNFQATGFDAARDLTDQIALNSAWLNQN